MACTCQQDGDIIHISSLVCKTVPPSYGIISHRTYGTYPNEYIQLHKGLPKVNPRLSPHVIRCLWLFLLFKQAVLLVITLQQLVTRRYKCSTPNLVTMEPGQWGTTWSTAFIASLQAQAMNRFSICRRMRPGKFFKISQAFPVENYAIGPLFFIFGGVIHP